MSLNSVISLRRIILGFPKLTVQNNLRIRKITTDSTLSNIVPKEQDESDSTKTIKDYRFEYPEFLPDPNPLYRNSLREKLERLDMLSRRTRIDIPTFFVGSILSVTYSEPHAVNKTNKFVGICIRRRGVGLAATFLLRNVVDNLGVEIEFSIYDPNIQSIVCLKLEKRLDPELDYLRDAPLEYSTFPFDMPQEIINENESVRINPIKIPLNSPPWIKKWEQRNLKGVEDLDTHKLTANRRRKQLKNAKPWEKYDLMKIYRETIPEHEQRELFAEISPKLVELEAKRKVLKRQRFLRKSKKTK